jgi:hypothetical protein
VDYPAVIAHPMDLGTVKQRLQNNNKHYSTPWEAHQDILLVWDNCMTYNQDGSEFYLLAASLRRKWEDKFRKLAKDLNWGPGGVAAGGAGEGSLASAKGAPKASLTDRRNFAKSLYQISQEDLGKVLVELEQKHPASLKRNASEDEVELTVDAIPASLLSELTQFIQACKKRANKKTKVSKPAAASAVAASS